MKLQQFDGGISRTLAPQLLNVNQAVEYVNIDNETGVLTPVATALQTTLQVGEFPYFFRAEQAWISGNTQKSFVEFQNTLYYADGVTAKKYKDGEEHNLGIAAPTVKATLAKTDAPDAPTEVAVTTVTTAGNLPTSELKYLLFNVASNGWYSEALEITIGASTTKTATITTVPSFPPNQQDSQRALAAFLAADVKRSMSFTAFKGLTGAKAELYRLHDGAYRKLADITSSSQIVVDAVYDISTNAELDIENFGPLSGVYSYVYTYYNSKDGAESAPSPVSAEADVGAGKITLSGLQVSSDPQVDKKRIYRVGGNITVFTLVATINNATTTYLDELKDTELASQLLESTDYDKAPAGLKYLVEAYAMLFGAVGPNLYFTPIGVPDAWPALNFIDFSEDITGIGVVANGLLVFTQYRTYIVSGTGPTTLTKYLLSGDQGCLNHYAIANLAGACLWPSSDGICVSDGSIPQVITKRTLGKVKLEPVQALVYDEVYYLMCESGRILAVDFRFNQIPKELDLNVSSIVVAQDVLYGYRDGYLFELFAGADKETFKYKSPRFIEGRATETKTYKKIYIYSEGVIELKVYVNDVLVATGSYDSADSHTLQIPQQLQRGFFIQFEITGTGTVYELEYVAGDRKDGQ